MKLLATLPPPNHSGLCEIIAKHHLVSGARFNVGASAWHEPEELLKELLDLLGDKPLYIDLKGRQLRITQWADPSYGDICLNHEIEGAEGAQIIFRGGDTSTITHVGGNKIYVDPYPSYALGAGQSVNIHGNNLKIIGYLTDQDKAFIAAAKKLNCHNYMASFVETEQDLLDILELDPAAEIIAKIESPKGLDFIRDTFPDHPRSLMVARDDLFINLDNQMDIIKAMNLIIELDPSAICASRILESLKKTDLVSLSDLSDLFLIRSLGYQTIMLSDSMCFNQEAFVRAMYYFEQFSQSILESS